MYVKVATDDILDDTDREEALRLMNAVKEMEHVDPVLERSEDVNSITATIAIED